MSESATSAGLSITVNGRERSVDPGTSVADLLDALDLKPGMVVVERNREILTRDAYSSVRIEAGDRLELVHFVGGG